MREKGCGGGRGLVREGDWRRREVWEGGVVEEEEERKCACVCVCDALAFLNPLLGATWPFVYFLQGRFGRAVIVTRTYWFVCPATVAKHLWCVQPVKEVQLTCICYVQICVYSSSYGESIIDPPCWLTPPVPIAIP